MEKKIYSASEIGAFITDQYPDRMIQFFIAEIILNTPVQNRSNRVRFTRAMNAIYGKSYRTPKTRFKKHGQKNDEEILLEAGFKYLADAKARGNTSKSCWKAAKEHVRLIRSDGWENIEDFNERYKAEINKIYKRVHRKFGLHQEEIIARVKNKNDRRFYIPPDENYDEKNDPEFMEQYLKIYVSMGLFFENDMREKFRDEEAPVSDPESPTPDQEPPAELL